jgi:hypothetical protein
VKSVKLVDARNSHQVFGVLYRPDWTPGPSGVREELHHLHRRQPRSFVDRGCLILNSQQSRGHFIAAELFQNLRMGLEADFSRLIDRSPRVVCPGCQVQMTLRTLVPVPQSEAYKAGYRCPKCGTETERQFKVDP